MRRKDREITDMDMIFKIIDNCQTVHVGMVDNEKPYVVALNFGYERQGDSVVIYLHSAYEGRKMDILRKNPNVFFQMDCVNELAADGKENPCSYYWKFDSVTGSGKVEFIEDLNEKARALNCIIRHLKKTEDNLEFPEEKLRKTCVYRVCSADISGKRHE